MAVIDSHHEMRWFLAFARKYREELEHVGAVLDFYGESSIQVLGYGSLGVVIPTSLDGLVVKVTLDQSEGIYGHYLAKEQHKDKDALAGFVWVDKFMRGPPVSEFDETFASSGILDHYGMSFDTGVVYVGVREEVDPYGKGGISHYISRWINGLQASVAWDKSRAGVSDSIRSYADHAPAELRLLASSLAVANERLGAIPFDLHQGNVAWPSHRTGAMADQVICHDFGSAGRNVLDAVGGSQKHWRSNPVRLRLPVPKREFAR